MSDGQVDENVNVGQLAVADAGRLEAKDIGRLVSAACVQSTDPKQTNLNLPNLSE